MAIHELQASGGSGPDVQLPCCPRLRTLRIELTLPGFVDFSQEEIAGVFDMMDVADVLEGRSGRCGRSLGEGIFEPLEDTVLSFTFVEDDDDAMRKQHRAMRRIEALQEDGMRVEIHSRTSRTMLRDKPRCRGPGYRDYGSDADDDVVVADS
ncbi:hypothetical protein BDV98DRAFT_576463, partial [Pterulicium gracile]